MTEHEQMFWTLMVVVALPLVMWLLGHYLIGVL